MFDLLTFAILILFLPVLGANDLYLKKLLKDEASCPTGDIRHSKKKVTFSMVIGNLELMSVFPNTFTMGTAERGKRQAERVNTERNTLGMKKSPDLFYNNNNMP